MNRRFIYIISIALIFVVVGAGGHTLLEQEVLGRHPGPEMSYPVST